MKFKVRTNNEEVSLGIRVLTAHPLKVFVKVYDADQPKIVLTDRYKTVKGEETFYVRLPLTGANTIVEVCDEYEKNMGKPSGNVQVASIDKYPLEKQRANLRNYGASTFSFIDFAQRFAFNSPYLATDKTYRSNDGYFMIEYFPMITDGQKELSTPARISKRTGIIQVSKKLFDTYTVPMRVAILLHEYSHFNLNTNINDEVEADLNGLMIYLSLGFPRIEGYQAFLEVFKDSPTNQNKNRYDVINNFIRDFETRRINKSF
jgi:hypothetical protein